MYQCSIHFTCFTTSSLFASSKLLSSEQIRHCILSDGSAFANSMDFSAWRWHGVYVPLWPCHRADKQSDISREDFFCL